MQYEIVFKVIGGVHVVLATLYPLYIPLGYILLVVLGCCAITHSGPFN